MKLIILGLASASLRLGAEHHHHREGYVMVGGCKVQGPGAVQTASGGGSHGTVDGVEPFMNVFRDGYWSVGCVSDEMVKSGDKYGDGKFDYKVRESANTSLVYYSEVVEDDKKESMTPGVCFEFCRTMPDMQFFGLIYGRECYCTPYYHQGTGEGACTAQCEGDASKTCGNTDGMADVYEMHTCGDAVEEAQNSVSASQEAIAYAQEVHENATHTVKGMDSMYDKIDEIGRAHV